MISRVIQEAGKVILGKEHQLKLSISCLFAQGNLLIEDLPGMGKTTLSQVLAQVMGLSYTRIQFTSDLLPADILGVSIYEKETGTFQFRPGPVFSQLILADEINRATPRTQSALLEAMEEKQVTLEGITRPLPRPFFVIATQNPSSQMGTFLLPESQLDRFLMRICLGYPTKQAEKSLLRGQDSRSLIKRLDTVCTPEYLIECQSAIHTLFLSESVIDYILRLVHFTREYSGFICGLSPRGSIAIARSAQAWAFIHGRDHVLPEDVQAILPAVVDHRVMTLSNTGEKRESASALLLAQVPVIAN